MAPSTPGSTGAPFSSRTVTAYPGTGTDGEPGLIGSVSRPRRLAAIGQPVSVCHQLSTTGIPSRSLAHCQVSGSSRSPARNRVRSEERSYAAAFAPAASSFLMARYAVGAVNIATAPYSEITRKNAPASGVPTGLPS